MASAPGPDHAQRTSDWARAGAIFLLIFTVYFIGYARTLPPTADEMIDFSLAQSFAKWQTAAIDQVSTVGPNPEEIGADGHRYSKYGPLQAALSVPLFLLAQKLPIGEVDTVLLLNHLVTAATGALLYLLVRRLGPRPGYSPVVALGIVAIVIFATPLWVETKRYFAEPTITLCVVATVLAAYRAASTGQYRWHIATGLAFGFAVAAKYIDALLLAPIPLYLAWAAAQGSSSRYAGLPHPNPLPEGEGIGRAPLPGGEGTGRTPLSEGEVTKSLSQQERLSGPLSLSEWVRVRDSVLALVSFGLGVLPIAGLLGWYNVVRFGNALATGYTVRETFSTPIWVGVAGFLFSPGKSIFVYTPIFLLLVVWAPRFIRRFPSFSAMLGAIIALHLGIYGAWWVWWGAWAWGPRFIVPILPLIALFLVEGIATERNPLVRGVAVVLGGLSVAIQGLGLAVDHTIYLVQLMPQNPRPDTLTLYDLRYSPILHQIPLMTRQWLDFAWVLRDGPRVVDSLGLGIAALEAAIAVACFALIWRVRVARPLLPLVVVGVVVAAGTLRVLADYNQQVDPTTAKIVSVLASAPSGSAVLQMAPNEVVPYANAQKRDLPEIGWIEEPTPGELINRRIDQLESRADSLWVLTDTPPKVPSNGIEAALDRSLVEIDDEPIGGLRLLHYLIRPAALPLVTTHWQFATGVSLAGYAVEGGPPAPGALVNLVLKWQALTTATDRPSYTVFVHLVTDDGTLAAQHDDPPAEGYASTDHWQAGQVVYDDHAIAIPANAPRNLHRFQVGLYLPSTGQRVPLVGAPNGASPDTVTLDVG